MSTTDGPYAFSPARLIATSAFFIAVAGSTIYYGGHAGNPGLLLFAVLTGAYLAMNIGANDAANNIGAAVGSGAITLGGALAVAVVGEIAGALLAGDQVGARLRDHLFEIQAFADGELLARVLISGLLAAALWLHLATLVRTPVSATHSVIGGMVGAAVIAGYGSAVQWEQIGSFALVWLITPLAAAVVSALVHHLIDRTVISQPNLIGAARSRVPVMITVLSLLLSDYFFVRVAPAEWGLAERHLIASMACAIAVFLVAQPWVHRKAQCIKSNRQGVNRLFVLPLIIAAAFFAFAHGANDAANVAAPLAVIASVAASGSTSAQLILPGWSLGVAALGIAAGLFLYGRRIVHTVGRELTEIDKFRAFCITVSSAFVVVVASHFGFPVSTTHTVIGSIFGVGLIREAMRLNERKTLEKIRKCHAGEDPATLDAFLARFQGATMPGKKRMLDALFQEHGAIRLSGKEIRRVNALYHRELVKRSLLRRIVAFWLLTLPCAALLGGVIFQFV